MFTSFWLSLYIFLHQLNGYVSTVGISIIEPRKKSVPYVKCVPYSFITNFTCFTQNNNIYLSLLKISYLVCFRVTIFLKIN